jgi:hypothetical protein
MKAGALLLAMALAACGSSSGDDDDGVVDSGSPPVDADTGPAVVIQGLSPRLVVAYTCDLDNAGPRDDGPCANYNISMSLTNGTLHGITRIDEVEIDIAGATLSPFDPLTCSTTPWIAAAGQNSGVIDLELYWYYAPVTAPALRYDCPVETDRVNLLLDGVTMPDAPADGSLTVRVTGILDDATPWTAERTAPIAD